jgi:hypothetical protein
MSRPVRGRSPHANKSQSAIKTGLGSQYSVLLAFYHPLISSTLRSAARFHDACDNVLSPKFHPYQRPGAPSPALSGSSTRSFKHSGRGLSPSPILYSSSNGGSPDELASKSGKSSTQFRSVTPSPTPFGLEAGYDDPPVLPTALETSPLKFARPEFIQFRSPVRPGLDLPETPAGLPTGDHLRTVAPSPLPALSAHRSNSNLSASLSGSLFLPSVSFGTTLVGSVNMSIENLKLATPKPSRAIQRSQSFTARPSDGVKRLPTYGGETSKVAQLFVPPPTVAKAPATPQLIEHGKGTVDPDATVKTGGSIKRKHTSAAPAPSAWDTRKKADKRPRTISGSDTEGWRSLVPVTSPSRMDISPPTPKAGISRGGVRVKRARKEHNVTPTQTTANAGYNHVTSRLTRSTKKLNDALGLSSPCSSSSHGPASPGSPMVTSPLGSKAPSGFTTKLRPTPHRRATSLLAGGSATITKEQLQDENQDTSMIVIEQPERRSTSPSVTRNSRRVGTVQFPHKVKRTKNQSGGDVL